MKLMLEKSGRKVNFQPKSLSLNGRIKKLVSLFGLTLPIAYSYCRLIKMAIKFPRTGITDWIHLEKLAVPQLVTIFHHFMVPERSLQHSQEQATFPCPEIHNLDHSLPFISLEFMLLLFCRINSGLASGLFSVAFLYTKNTITPCTSLLSCMLHSPASLFYHLNTWRRIQSMRTGQVMN
jgi:hypothetical protein